MKTFKIFKKSEKFFWSRSRIIGIFFFVSLSTLVIKLSIIGKTESEIIEKISGYFCLILMMLGLINSFRRQQLPGKLEGIIKFEIDGITIENKKYFLEDIRLIKINITDYVGQQISSNVGLWEIFSNGIGNKIIIILNTGETIVRNFQLKTENEIMRAYPEINNYYKNGKIIKSNYIEITT